MTAAYDLSRIRRLLLLLPAAARAARNDRGVPLAEAARLTGARSTKQVIEDVDAVASLWVDPGEGGDLIHLYVEDGEVPRWHLLLHREARDLASATEGDTPRQQFEDELFDRLYSGAVDLLPEKERNSALREWAEKVHAVCEQLPAFARLAQECKGRPAAAATAVEALMGELDSLTESPNTPSQQQRARRRVVAGCERASAAIDELMESMEGLGQVLFQNVPGTGTGLGADLPVSTIRGLARRLRDDARLRRIALLAGRMKRIAASKRRQKVKHGADEITEITQGADIARLLPSELCKLTRRSLRLLFMRDLLERQCLRYQLTGSHTLGKGPLVLALDKSGSMEGPRDIWATALALALLDQAQRENRMFALTTACWARGSETATPLPSRGISSATSSRPRRAWPSPRTPSTSSSASEPTTRCSSQLAWQTPTSRCPGGRGAGSGFPSADRPGSGPPTGPWC